MSGQFHKMRRSRFPLFWLALLGSTCGFGATVSVNGTCHVGNCTSPDVAAAGAAPSTPFNVVVTLPNTDRYRISGSVEATSSGNAVDLQAPFTVTYLGNGAGKGSSEDVLTIDISQNYEYKPHGGRFFEVTRGGFEGPIAAGSSVVGQLFVGGQPLPRQGPFPVPAATKSFLVNSGPLPLTGLGNPLLLDLRRTVTFAGGSDVGSKVINVVNHPEQPTK